MAGRMRVCVRVVHEPDRSYRVLVDGPAGDVAVGSTTSTGEVLRVAREGAARLFGVPLQDVEVAELRFPQPPYGVDGQLVRIGTGDDVPEEDRGALGQAHWFGHGGAWFVTVAGSGTGVLPSESLDFAPAVSAGERATLEDHLRRD